MTKSEFLGAMLNLGMAVVAICFTSVRAHACHHAITRLMPRPISLRTASPSADASSPKFFAGSDADDELALKKRFKELAAELHPDVNAGSQDANAAFQELTAEYSRLRQ